MTERRKRRAQVESLDVTATNPFEELGLSSTVLAAVEDMAYGEPTPVQKQAIPAVLSGHDVMAAAQTGTGKTAAFLLPGLDTLGRAGRREGPLMLVITPTRELAQQITEVAKTICARTHQRVTSVVGGVGYEPQKDALKRGCDLLVATPGRLIDLIEQGACSLGQVKLLVLDEADRMLDMGFLPDVRRIVERTPKDRQTLLFSATLSGDVLKDTRDLIHDPVRVEIAPRGTAAETVTQYVLGVSPEAKKRVLVEVLRREGSERVIAFVNGKHRADHLCRILKKKGISCAPIHGNRSQNQRMRALAQFACGEVGVLLATDVLARGIDVADVAYVINVDVPHDAQDYIHRIGRTGRAGEQGWALTLCTEEEYLDLRLIERLMGKLIADYPHASELDRGEEPFELEAERSPEERLPGKKSRKRRSRKKPAAPVAAQEATPKAERKPASKPAPKPEPKAVDKSAPRAETSEAPKLRPRPKAASKPKPKVRRAPQAAGQGQRRRNANGDGRPKQARRRPGDRRGAPRRG
ncbi:MAG: DEAD/DEAH box helicase [Coriobacteriales bacterium]|nr:DEAD/DEAH box helicase [Coriobacteriales bacterium]